jgi:hypothetical protein
MNHALIVIPMVASMHLLQILDCANLDISHQTVVLHVLHVLQERTSLLMETKHVLLAILTVVLIKPLHLQEHVQ